VAVVGIVGTKKVGHVTGSTRHSSDVDDTRSRVCGAGQDFDAEDLRVGWSSKATLDLREETGVRSSVDALGELGREMGRLYETAVGRPSVRLGGAA
jgi:hypothetical protein